MRRLAAVVALVVAGAAGLTVGAGAAHAATWCGTTTTQDRPPALTGRSIHVIYAYPSDGSERSAQLASQLSADVDTLKLELRKRYEHWMAIFGKIARDVGLKPQ